MMDVHTIAYVTKNMMKSLIISGVVIVISITIMAFDPTAGIIVMMLYSSFMVVKSAGKAMPLNAFTAILPGLMSLVIFFVMLGLIGVDNKTMPLIGIGLGIIPGWLMARGHKVYTKNGTVYAKRTFFYVLIWVLSLLFTQGSTWAGMREITDFGFLLNGFSTAMMLVLSVILFKKIYTIHHLKLKKNTLVASLFVIFLMHIMPTSSMAYTIEKPFSEEKLKQLGHYIFRDISLSGKREDTIIYYTGKTAGIPEEYGAGITFVKHPRIRAPLPFHKGGSRHHNGELFSAYLYYKVRPVHFLKDTEEICRKGNSPGVFNTTVLLYRKYYDVTRNRGKGVSCTRLTNVQTNAFKINDRAETRVVWEYGDWILTVTAWGYPNYPESILGKNYIHYVLSKTNEFQQRIKSIKVIENTSDHHHSHVSDDALAAGIATALLMLLASFGMHAAMLAAQASSSPPESGGEEEEDSSDDYVRGTRMLDGSEAEAWMKDHGYIKDNERPELFVEDRLHDFMHSMPTEKASGLQGFARDTDDPEGSYVILVDEESVQRPQKPEEAPEVKKKEPEIKKEEPKEEPEVKKEEKEEEKYKQQLCNDQKYRLQELTKKVNEQRQKIQQTLDRRDAILRAMENRRKAAGSKMLIDLGGTLWSMLSAGKVNLLGSLLQSVISKYTKYIINVKFDQDFDDGTGFTDTEKSGYTLETITKATAKLNSAFQTWANANSFGSTFSNTLLELDKMRAEIHQLRLENITAYHLGTEFEEMRKDAEYALHHCIEVNR